VLADDGSELGDPWATGGPRKPWAVRAGTMIVVRTLCVFNAGLLVALGTIFAVFMERPAGLLFAAACWAIACLMACCARIADRLYLRHRD
jgi:hypothetical protein